MPPPARASVPSASKRSSARCRRSSSTRSPPIETRSVPQARSASAETASSVTGRSWPEAGSTPRARTSRATTPTTMASLGSQRTKGTTSSSPRASAALVPPPARSGSRPAVETSPGAAVPLRCWKNCRGVRTRTANPYPRGSRPQDSSLDRPGCRPRLSSRSSPRRACYDAPRDRAHHVGESGSLGSLTTAARLA